MKIPIYQVDAFANHVFEGNPAAVCPLTEWPEDDLLQKIALENNVSETAFFIPYNNNYHIRWFTPVEEVRLCGHATLASAFILFNKLGFSDDTIRFTSLSGELIVSMKNDRLALNFPTDSPVEIEIDPLLVKSIGISPTEAYQGTDDFLYIFKEQQDIISINPDFRLLASQTKRGLIVSAPGNNVDFVSRFFCPAIGIDEDPATGSIHTLLTPYWSKKLSKKSMVAHQLSNRGGELFLNNKGERTEISGKGVLYMEGNLTV